MEYPSDATKTVPFSIFVERPPHPTATSYGLWGPAPLPSAVLPQSVAAAVSGPRPARPDTPPVRLPSPSPDLWQGSQVQQWLRGVTRLFERNETPPVHTKTNQQPPEYQPMECQQGPRNTKCPCSATGCVRHGYCCQCVAHHRAKGQLPACFFPKDVELTHDRSIERLVATYNERGPWWNK